MGVKALITVSPQARAAEDSLQWYRREPQQELEAELKEMEAAVAAAGEQRVRDTAAKLLRPANLRPLMTVLALFLLYPLTGVYNISFFAVSLFTRLGLGGAETVAVFTALVRCGGTLASTLLLLRSGGALQQPSSHTVFRVGRRVIFLVTTSLATLIIGTIGVLVIVKDAGDNHLLRSSIHLCPRLRHRRDPDVLGADRAAHALHVL